MTSQKAPDRCAPATRCAPVGACFVGVRATARPFQSYPALFDHPAWVGLKGASGYGKADDVSTGANEVSEARSEAPDRSRSGLSGCSRSV
jgi:hypothetical protein